MVDAVGLPPGLGSAPSHPFLHPTAPMLLLSPAMPQGDLSPLRADLSEARRRRFLGSLLLALVVLVGTSSDVVSSQPGVVVDARALESSPLGDSPSMSLNDVALAAAGAAAAAAGAPPTITAGVDSGSAPAITVPAQEASSPSWFALEVCVRTGLLALGVLCTVWETGSWGACPCVRRPSSASAPKRDQDGDAVDSLLTAFLVGSGVWLLARLAGAGPVFGTWSDRDEGGAPTLVFALGATASHLGAVAAGSSWREARGARPVWECIVSWRRGGWL